MTEKIEKEVVPDTSNIPKPVQIYYKVPGELMVAVRRFLGSCPHDNVVQLVALLQRVERVEE